MKLILSRLKCFLFETLWETPLKKLSFFKKYSYAFLRSILLTIYGIKKHILFLHAAALTYVSLMSMVPMFALMFSVSKGLGAQNRLRENIHNWLMAMPEQIQTFIETIFIYVDRTDFSALGVIGLLLLFYSSVSVLSNIEHTFNGIWSVQRSRPFFRKIADYISVIFIIPILLMGATSLHTALQSPHILDFLSHHLGPMVGVYKKGVIFTSSIIIWFTFAFLYIFIPNRKVNFIPAFLGGIVAGELWQLIQWLYIHGQISLTKYNAIYGAFAIIPIFLIWLYAVWIVVLLGAEISFSIQNCATEKAWFSRDLKLNYSTTKFLSVWICAELWKHFQSNNGSWSAKKFMDRFNLAENMVMPVIRLLEENAIISSSGKQMHYLPLKNIATLSIDEVLKIVQGDNLLKQEKFSVDESIFKILDFLDNSSQVEKQFQNFNQLIENSYLK